MWSLDGEQWRLDANLSQNAVQVADTTGQIIWLEGEEIRNGSLPPWTVRWMLVPGELRS